MVSALSRRLARDTVHSSLLPSACSVEEVAMHNRLDPYWDQLWAPGSQASWASIRTARTHKNNGWGRVNAKLLPNHKEATRLLASTRRRADRLATWGALNSWTAVSAEQLAAFTGSRYVLDPRGSTIAASFAVDLLDIGMFPNPLAAIPNPDRNYLYRAARSDAFEKHIVPTLTWPEWASVTGGLGWASGGQYDRHNLLAAELCLRVAEYLPIGAILGEKFSTVDLLAGSGLGRTVKRPDNRRADGTIVRSDDMRIALELTATTSRGLESKVRRWARLLTERSLETSGLTVLFVAAPHPDRKFGGGKDPRRGIYETVRGVLKEFPGRGPDSAAARIGVTSWEDWFPGQHQLSERFFHLEADFMLGPGPGPERWTTRRMLTDYTFEPWHTFDATAVVDNAPILAATPHWMRTADRTHLIGTPADRAAVRVPHPAPVRPHLAKGRPLAAGTGGAGDAKLPVRLRLDW